MNVASQARRALHLELASESLREFSEIRFVAHGTSMLPALHPGDCLTVSAFGDQLPRIGDIVLCRRGTEFRVHRLVRILHQASFTLYILRGDSLTEDDTPVPACDLLGRITALQRGAKSFEIAATETLLNRVLRWMIRHSKIAMVLFLRWHALNPASLFHSEPPPAASIEAETERA